MKDYFFGTEYDISPAGGETGQAFVAIHKDEKFFLKRNSSPFLAALSVEKIVPKLIWTRRVENGDVITAQKWINAHILTADEMTDPRVTEILFKIHQSKPLRAMLAKIEDRDLSAPILLERLKEKLPVVLTEVEQAALCYLEEKVSEIIEEVHTVCHGDIHHNNWIISEAGEMFLVDWDEALLADPAIDLAMLLYQYIPKNKWEELLSSSGIILDAAYQQKLKWYAFLQILNRLHTKNHFAEKEKLQHLLISITNE
ncbi:phosphotransferase family protein [Listeria sp. PSOL-1]|uniref:phosphotransferase family protein n=1 Tax=Listeria sp. PSOL-1 TaxID=1844999 RepID=UPI0013CF9533|nr:phosphotransferase family protein [Listeria sp. PSOL-1]